MFYKDVKNYVRFLNSLSRNWISMVFFLLYVHEVLPFLLNWFAIHKWPRLLGHSVLCYTKRSDKHLIHYYVGHEVDHGDNSSKIQTKQWVLLACISTSYQRFIRMFSICCYSWGQPSIDADFFIWMFSQGSRESRPETNN